LGTFFFSLIPGYAFNVYGIGGILALPTAFSIAALSGWVDYLIIIVFLIFLLASLVQLIGIPNGIAAIVGGGISLIFCIFIILGSFGVLSVFPERLGILFDSNDWFTNIIPVTVNFGSLGLGTIIAAVGGGVTLVSGFLPRD
jgi:hypothetical protein